MTGEGSDQVRDMGGDGSTDMTTKVESRQKEKEKRQEKGRRQVWEVDDQDQDWTEDYDTLGTT